MIWQYHSWLALPETDPRKTWPVEGNIRTFWYHLKPVISRLGVLDAGRQYDQMVEIFTHLVCRRKFFRYRDFGFVAMVASRATLTSSAPVAFPFLMTLP